MADVENQSSEEAVAQPETEVRHDLPEQQEAQQEDKSWVNQLRRERNEFKRKAEMQEELLRTLAANQVSQQAQPQPEEDFLAEIEREEYVPGAKVAKGFKKLEARFANQLQEIEKKYQQKAQNDAYSDLKREMPDLEDVVNHETLELVAKTNPRLRQTWVGKSDYEIYVQAYPYIKNSGLLDQVPGERRAKQVEKKIEQNKKTVPSPQVFDKRPIAQAFNAARISEEQKQSLRDEMYHYGSMAHGVPPIQ
jgi:hypothetical protein